MQTKTCGKCKTEKPVDKFFKDKHKPDGIRNRCIECCKKDVSGWRERNRSAYNNYAAQWRANNPDRQHANEIKRHYGVTKDQYNQMLIDQNYGCKICGKKHDETKKRGRLYVDHCHASDKVRGLLCGACNSAIGYFEDNIVVMQAAIDYVKKTII